MVEGTKNRPLLLGAYRQMVFYGIQVDDRKVMEEYIGKGMKHLEEDKHSSDYATFLRLKGLLAYRCDRLDEADEILVEAFKLFTSLINEECRYQLSRAACLNYRGKIHMKRGLMAEGNDAMEEYRQAELLFRKAIEVGVCHYVTNGMGQFRSNLGQSLYYQGRYAEAEAPMRESLQCFSRHEGFYWGWDRAEAFAAMLCNRLGLKTEAGEHLAAAEKMIPIMANPWNMLLLEECRREVRGEN